FREVGAGGTWELRSLGQAISLPQDFGLAKNWSVYIEMHRYVIIGVQGSGKGTHAKLLSQDFEIVHISVGEIFRWHIQTRTKLGAKIKKLVDAGQFVSDEIVEEIVSKRLEQHDWSVGYILDGFPR